MFNLRVCDLQASLRRLLQPWCSRAHEDPNPRGCASGISDFAQNAADPTVTQAVFDAFHLYAGAGIGEHFGYLFTALWTISVAVALWHSHRLIAGIGVVLALGVIAGMAEPFGFALAGIINATAYTFWALWLVVLGIIILRV